MQWFKQQKADVIFLQESHYTKATTCYIDVEWHGKSFHCFGTNNSKGVSVLLGAKVPMNVIDHHCLDNGRGILVNIETDETIYTLVNIYAPNKGRERDQFFRTLFQWVSEHKKGTIVMGGDFNIVLDDDIDKKSDGVKRHVNNKVILEMIRKYKLTDVWRVKHVNVSQYTWRQSQPAVACRLDYWLLDKALMSQVISCDIRPAVKTDHKAVSLKISRGTNKRGPGTWKLNVSLLDDVIIKNRIAHTIDDCVKTCTNSQLNAKHTWELCKVKIRETFIACAKENRSKLSCKKASDLQKQLEDVDARIDKGDNNPDTLTRQRELSIELEQYYKQQATGAQIRSRANWVEKGERSTSYFFGLEKKKQTQKCISSVKTVKGDTVREKSAVLRELNSYYSSLYSSRNPLQSDIDTYLDAVQLEKVLTEHDKRLCEGLLANDECKAAIGSMKSNKSPGSDGLPVEFYKMFWPLVGNLVLESLNEGYENGCMSASQKHAIISLIYKKNDPESLDNWRPISLLNIDYKIATAVLARRLQCVLGNIISTDQSGYIKGRYIGHNIRLINDIINYTETENLGGAVLFLDFRKAFDTVEWDFMYSTLTRFGFGDSFIKWVKTIYNETTSCINNYGWLSDNFSVERGIRQGCPLSALLFIIVAEIMAVKIRSSEKIRGIKIKGMNKEIKLTQLADDTTVFAGDRASIEECIKLVNEFSVVAGPELNLSKTEGLWLGTDKFSQEKPCGLNWPADPIKALGIYFGHDDKKCDELNWNSKLHKLESKLLIWSRRNLTMLGKILIVKSVGLSQLVYNASVLCVPDYIRKQVKTLVYQFIWNRKSEKIKRTTLIGDYSEGGLRAPDIDSMFSSLKARWMYRLFNDDSSNWSILPRMYFEQYGPNMSIVHMNLNKPSVLPGTLPVFYKQVLCSWIECGGCKSKEPTTFAEVRKQFIWGNQLIKFKRKPLIYLHWMHSGIMCINDLLNCNSGFSSNIVYNKLRNKTNWAAEYYTVINSIPNEWKPLLHSIESKNSKVKCSLALRRFDLKKGYVQDGCTSRSMYSYLISKKAVKSHMENYWSVKFSHSIFRTDWQNVWFLCTHMQERKLGMFRYKLLHNILPCKLLLHRWRLSESPQCNVCKVVEDYQHLFINCKMVKHAWQYMCNLFTKLGMQNISPSLKVIMMGYKSGQKPYTEVNEIITIFAFALFKSYCMSENWTKYINVIHIVKQEFCYRYLYYKMENRKLCILEKVCSLIS